MASLVRGKKNKPAGGTGPTGKTMNAGKQSDNWGNKGGKKK